MTHWIYDSRETRFMIAETFGPGRTKSLRAEPMRRIRVPLAVENVPTRATRKLKCR